MDEILSVPGIDVAMVGPSDLALSMSLTPQLGPIEGRHVSAIARVLEACKTHRVLPGIYGGNAAATIAYRDMGFRFLAAATDVSLLRAGAQLILRELRTEEQTMQSG